MAAGGRNARSRDFLACSAVGDRSRRRDSPTPTGLIKHTATFIHAERSKGAELSVELRRQTGSRHHSHPNEKTAPYSWLKRPEDRCGLPDEHVLRRQFRSIPMKPSSRPLQKGLLLFPSSRPCCAAHLRIFPSTSISCTEPGWALPRGFWRPFYPVLARREAVPFQRMSQPGPSGRLL